MLALASPTPPNTLFSTAGNPPRLTVSLDSFWLSTFSACCHSPGKNAGFLAGETLLGDLVGEAVCTACSSAFATCRSLLGLAENALSFAMVLLASTAAVLVALNAPFSPLCFGPAGFFCCCFAFGLGLMYLTLLFFFLHGALHGGLVGFALAVFPVFAVLAGCFALLACWSLLTKASCLKGGLFDLGFLEGVSRPLLTAMLSPSSRSMLSMTELWRLVKGLQSPLRTGDGREDLAPDSDLVAGKVLLTC